MNETNGNPDCGGCHATESSSPLRTIGPIEDGIGRRTFLVQSGILAAMAALAACGASTDGTTAPTVPTNSQINVASYPALANVGGVAMVSISGAPVAIVRTSTTSFIALSRVCPHQGGIVQQSGSRFVCPIHGATFDLNGTWIGGQRTSSLHQYATTYNAASNTLTIG